MENSRIEQIKKFLTQTPDDTFLNYALAIEFVAVSKNEEAMKIFQKLIKNNPEYSATYYQFGKLLLKENDRQGAIKIFEDGILIARKNNEHHAASELQAALNEVLFDEE
ncbi:MAG: tetratricopeptide repeat protein [Bacteroidetes bacterium]|nr:tetratricopeptide repeat protein [Bacteroidota bacterium]